MLRGKKVWIKGIMTSRFFRLQHEFPRKAWVVLGGLCRRSSSLPYTTAEALLQ